MNTFEEVKKIKWIVKQIAEDVKKNGFSTRFASLYLENDEDTEIWERDCKGMSKGNSYLSLILFTAEIKCKYFNICIIIDEESPLVTLGKYDSDEEQFDIEGYDSLRKFLIAMSRSLEWEFRTEDGAYNSLLKDLNNRKTN
jgi:hypothetical protein